MSSEAVDSPPLPKPTTRAATLFGSPIAAVVLGIVLPLICLAFDPIVLSATFGQPILGSFKIGVYGFVALSMFALVAWLTIRRFPSLFCGFLLGGCVFALLLGIILLPMSVLGLLAIIGILGFSPFLTAATFWYCAMNARDVAGDRFKPVLAASAFFIFIALPIGTQVYTSHITENSIGMLVNGSDQSTERAIRRLEMLGPLFDADMLVWRYYETDSEVARKRLASTYAQLTGDDIQDRLNRLLD
jgi:hypothetical protein